MVIIGNSGDGVFACEVGADWKVRRSHFPATALLTDGALVTRNFGSSTSHTARPLHDASAVARMATRLRR